MKIRNNILLFLFLLISSYANAQVPIGPLTYKHFFKIDDAKVKEHKILACKIYSQFEKEGKIIDSVFIERNLFFDKEGRTIQDVDLQLNWLNTYFYDTNKILEHKREHLNKRLTYNTKYFYSKKGLVKKAKSRFGDGRIVSNWVYKYKQEKTSTMTYFSSGKKSLVWIYEDYNDFGKYTKLKMINFDQNKETKSIFIYDLEGKLIEVNKYSANQILISKTERFYNADSLLIKVVVSDKDNQIKEIYQSTYNEFGLIAKVMAISEIKNNNFVNVKKQVRNYVYSK